MGTVGRAPPTRTPASFSSRASPGRAGTFVGRSPSQGCGGPVGSWAGKAFPVLGLGPLSTATSHTAGPWPLPAPDPWPQGPPWPQAARLRVPPLPRRPVRPAMGPTSRADHRKRGEEGLRPCRRHELRAPGTEGPQPAAQPQPSEGAFCGGREAQPAMAPQGPGMGGCPPPWPARPCPPRPVLRQRWRLLRPHSPPRAEGRPRPSRPQPAPTPHPGSWRPSRCRDPLPVSLCLATGQSWGCLGSAQTPPPLGCGGGRAGSGHRVEGSPATG